MTNELAPIGSLWRDREGNTWRVARENPHSNYVSLTGVMRFDGVPFSNATWHVDPLIDLKPPKAVRVDA